MMIQFLHPLDRAKAKSIFKDLDFHLAVSAILEGRVPGVVFADDPDRPTAALARFKGRFFLAGSPENDAFNAALAVWFAEKVYPQALSQGQRVFSLFYSDGWEEPIERVILKGKAPIQSPRQYYEFKALKNDWRALLPQGFALHPVDRDLLARQSLRNLDDLVEELQSERESVDAFLENSFGVCLLNGEEIAGWCLSEYNDGRRCEVGIATVGDYQRRGFATLTGSAFVEEARSRGVTEIGWDCFASNLPSAAAARKIGFELVKEYKFYFAWFDEVFNLALNGDVCMDQEQYSRALEWFEQAFRRGEAPGWAYFEAGCASAVLGDDRGAFRYLGQALDHGFTRPAAFLKSAFLEGLREKPGWEGLVERLGLC